MMSFKGLNRILLTVCSMRWQWAIDNLVVGRNIAVKISTTLLVKISDYVHVGTVGRAVTTEAWTHTPWCNILIAFRILRPSRYRHLLRLASPTRRGLLDLLMVLILLQVPVRLRMSVILLSWICWETASHGVGVCAVEAILDVNSLIVDTTVCVIDFLNAARWRGKRVSIDLWVEPGGVVATLDHIKPSIWRR